MANMIIIPQAVEIASAYLESVGIYENNKILTESATWWFYNTEVEDEYQLASLVMACLDSKDRHPVSIDFIRYITSVFFSTDPDFRRYKLGGSYE